MNTPSLKGQIHEEIEKIFRTLLPQNGLAVREEQIALCHIMLDALLKNSIALCDAGVGIGKTYAYLTGCILLRKNAPHSAVGSLPVVVSTSSIALQDAIIEEYIPFFIPHFSGESHHPEAHPSHRAQRQRTVCMRCPPCPASGSRERQEKEHRATGGSAFPSHLS